MTKARAGGLPKRQPPTRRTAPIARTGRRPGRTPPRTLGDPEQRNPLLHEGAGGPDDRHTIHRRPLMAKRPTPDRGDQPTATTPATPTVAAGPRELPLVALRETVIFPEMIVPLQVGR